MEKVDVRQSKLNHDLCLEPILFKCPGCDKWELSTAERGRVAGEGPWDWSLGDLGSNSGLQLKIYDGFG